jgi:hypothetical protein
MAVVIGLAGQERRGRGTTSTLPAIPPIDRESATSHPRIPVDESRRRLTTRKAPRDAGS